MTSTPDEENPWDDQETSPEADESLARLSSAFAGLYHEDEPEDEEPAEESVAAQAIRPAKGTGAKGSTTGKQSWTNSTDDDEQGEVTPRNIVEAMLFVGSPDNRPLTAQEMAEQIRGVEAEEVKQLVEELNQQYAEWKRPYAIVAADGGFRLCLRAEFQPVRERFYGKLKETRLSQAAVEVLAVVAYHEPLTADQVQQLRNAPSGALLSQLVRRELLRMERGADKKTPPLYYTTPRFLSLFSLESLDDLPRTQDIDWM